MLSGICLGNFCFLRSSSNHRTVIRSCEHKANERVHGAVLRHKGGLSSSDFSEMACSFCSLLINAALACCLVPDPCPWTLWQRPDHGTVNGGEPTMFCSNRDVLDGLVSFQIHSSNNNLFLNDQKIFVNLRPLEIHA